MHDKVFSQKILNNTKNSIKLAMKENIEKDFASAALPLVLLAWVCLEYGENAFGTAACIEWAFAML